MIKYFPFTWVRRKISEYSIVRLIEFSVLQTGQLVNGSVSSHSTHIAICPQLQNKTLGGLVRHITHSSDLNDLVALICFIIFSSFFSSCNHLYTFIFFFITKAVFNQN